MGAYISYFAYYAFPQTLESLFIHKKGPNQQINNQIYLKQNICLLGLHSYLCS